jgi:hypothetical protein
MGSSTRRSSHGSSSAQPHASIPTSRRPSALTATDKHCGAALIEIGLGERQRLVDAQPGPPQNHDQPAQPTAMRVITSGAHDGDDLFDFWADRPGSADPCCAAADRHGNPASSPVTDVDRRDQAATRT